MKFSFQQREYSWTTWSLETITKVVGIILDSKSFLMEKNRSFINISSIHLKLLQFDQGISLKEDCQCSITYHRSKSWRAQSLQITYVMDTWWQWRHAIERQCTRNSGSNCKHSRYKNCKLGELIWRFND